MKKLSRTNIETLTYEYEDGFMVDIVKTITDGIGDQWDVWLYHTDYGYKEYLFGVPMNTGVTSTLESFLELVEDNLETGPYIDDYRESYMEV